MEGEKFAWIYTYDGAWTLVIQRKLEKLKNLKKACLEKIEDKDFIKGSSYR